MVPDSIIFGEHTPRSYRRQLVGITDQQERGPVGHGREQLRHQFGVHHGGLVDHHQITVEWILPIAQEAPLIGMKLKQAMDGRSPRRRSPPQAAGPPGRLAHRAG